ncbi:MAG: porin family protein [Niastella sp.]|nr:porin family protein [Niastella sp.]
MKNKMLPLALAFSILSASCLAQGFQFGVKAGTDIQKINSKSFSEQFSYGYHLGIFSEISLSSKFSIQPEFLFSSVNIDTSSNYSDVYKFGNMKGAKLRYFKIPLILNYKLNPFIYLQAGPQFGILKSADKNLLQTGQQAFKEGDFSMLGGVQINVSKFKIYGRYALGLTNLNDIDNKEKWKSQGFQLGIGIAF